MHGSFNENSLLIISPTTKKDSNRYHVLRVIAISLFREYYCYSNKEEK